MQDFLSFPAPAKINLFLHIVGQRADGYHLLQSVFSLLDFHDTVHLKLRTDGIISRSREIPGVAAEQDLCVRAAKLLKQYSGSCLGVDIAVDKRIPMVGGLGGGSSDAATVLLALNRLWHLDLSRQTLIELGLELGADVPFFIFGENAWVEGIGEELKLIELPYRYYLIITPPAHVSTAQVFASKELTRNTNPTTIAAFLKGLVRNDLEPVVCQQYPAIASSLEFLKKFGDARMSGSGSSVFVGFSSQAEAELAHAGLPQQFAGFLAHGLQQHPLHSFAK